MDGKTAGTLLLRMAVDMIRVELQNNESLGYF
jgi:hypothetical protein